MKRNSCCGLRCLPRLVFTRWTGEGYAVLMSLLHPVVIGVLPLVYTLCTFGQKAFAQTTPDTIPDADLQIDSVWVGSVRPRRLGEAAPTATYRLDEATMRSLPSFSSLQNVLQNVPGLDVRQRAAHGIQADLSIRGSGFDQVLFLVNGVDFTDAQTGHHTLNVPLRAEALQRVEVLNSPSARLWGPGAFAGAVNATTINPDQPGVHAMLQGGMYGLYDTYVGGASGWQGPVKLFAYVAGGGAQGAFPNTDYERIDAMTTLQVALPQGSIKAQCGYVAKDFGAQAFYTPKFPEQKESVRTLMGSVGYDWWRNAWRVHATVAYRIHKDQFFLFRHRWPAWYSGPNRHQSQLYSARVGSKFTTKRQSLSIALIGRFDEILSTNLGDPLSTPRPIPYVDSAWFTHYGQRVHLSLAAEEQLYLGPVTLTLGGMAGRSNAYGWGWGYGLHATYTWLQHGTLYAGANSAYRLPTLTDLYYVSPTRQGNMHLAPEEALHTELGIRWSAPRLQASLAAYYRLGHNVIDWVQRNPQEQQRVAQNHARVDAVGGELSCTYQVQRPWLGSLSVGYAYCYLYAPKAEELVSSYTFDNIRHQAWLHVVTPLWDVVTLSTTFRFGQRVGSYLAYPSGESTQYPPQFALDMKLEKNWKGYSFFVGVTNVLNAQYVDFGGVPLPGIWCMGGIAYRWGSLR